MELKHIIYTYKRLYNIYKYTNLYIIPYLLNRSTKFLALDLSAGLGRSVIHEFSGGAEISLKGRCLALRTER